MWNAKTKRRTNPSFWFTSSTFFLLLFPPPHLPILFIQTQTLTNTSLLQRAQPVGKKVWVLSTQVRSNQDDKVEKKEQQQVRVPLASACPDWQKQKAKPQTSSLTGPNASAAPPCNYTLEWLDSEENWRPELRTAAIFSLHHTSVITWEMNSPGSKLLQNSQRKYGSVFQ